MKAVVLHEYGGPDKLKYEDFDDPKPGPEEILIRTAAASINPVDWKMRSGAAKGRFPVEFPGILGRDISGIVREVGEGVDGFAPGDHVFGMTHKTYAELCVAQAAELAKLPKGMELVDAAALPLVSLTGEQLIRLAANIQPGQTVLIAGAVGGVGRVAVWTAKDMGAKVIAGVRKKQLKEAETLGADELVALDDEQDMQRVGTIDAVADAVGGKTGEMLLGKVKQGGVFGTVVATPANAAMHPTVTVQRIMAKPDPERMLRLAKAMQAGTLVIPIDRMIPLAEASAGQRAAERGGIGKVLLLA